MHPPLVVVPVIFLLDLVYYPSYFRFIRPMSPVDLSSFPSEDIARASAMPKVELHLHLDGSLSSDFIGRRALVRGKQLPVPPERLRQFLMDKKLEKLNQDDNRAEKNGNWPVFDFCNQFLQTKYELKEGTLDLISRLAKENVVYAEIRFCPELHTREGLDEETVIESVLEGARAQTQVIVGILLVALRSKDSAHGIRTAQLAAKYLQQAGGPAGVVGMDVAGDEGTYPLQDENHSMVAGVREAMQLGVPLTLHAGEWPEKFGSVGNLRWAIENGARRIGHSIAVRSDPGSLEVLKSKNITIEVCLTSNIGNGFKVKNYAEHPVKLLQESGVQYSLSCDNLLLSGDKQHAPSPTAELLHLALDVGLGWPAARASVIKGLKAAFSPTVNQSFIDAVQKRIDLIT